MVVWNEDEPLGRLICPTHSRSSLPWASTSGGLRSSARATAAPASNAQSSTVGLFTAAADLHLLHISFNLRNVEAAGIGNLRATRQRLIQFHVRESELHFA